MKKLYIEDCLETLKRDLTYDYVVCSPPDFDELDKAIDFSYEDFIKYKGFSECKEAGKLKLEGKDYLVKDGDVMFFRTGA